LFSYLSQSGYQANAEYSKWILENIVILFEKFESKFIALWNERQYKSKCFQNSELLRAFPALTSSQSDFVKTAFLHEIWLDTLGFSATELIRRIVGIAHVEDLEGIEDPIVRSFIEKRCLILARHLMLQATNLVKADFCTLPLVHSPKDLLSALDALNKLDISTVIWPK
jgi:5-methylthioribose kinase